MENENLERNFNEIPEEQRKREKREFIASTTGGGPVHKYEAEYWETQQNVWTIVPGTLKDLGPAKEKMD